MDNAEIQLLMHAERARREREAPRDRRQLENVVTIAVAISVASAWDKKSDISSISSAFRTVPEDYPEAARSRLLGLFRDDPMFHHTVRTATAQIMAAFEDYLRLRVEGD